jgi:hypothetical protein
VLLDDGGLCRRQSGDVFSGGESRDGETMLVVVVAMFVVVVVDVVVDVSWPLDDAVCRKISRRI